MTCCLSESGKADSEFHYVAECTVDMNILTIGYLSMSLGYRASYCVFNNFI